MKKLLKLPILALFVGLTSVAFGQANQANLDEIAQAVRADSDNAAAIVEEAVTSTPDEMVAITERLIAEFPELTEEIILGAIAAMPTPLDEDELDKFLNRIVAFRPGLAPEIVIGARRATTPAMEPVISGAVRNALQTAINGGNLPVIGRTSQPSVSPASYNPTIRVISPSQ